MLNYAYAYKPESETTGRILFNVFCDMNVVKVPDIFRWNAVSEIHMYILNSQYTYILIPYGFEI